MNALPRTIPVLFGLVFLASAAGEEPVVDSFVHDEAGLFRAATREKASEEITAIRQLSQRDVIIETMKALPAEDGKKFKAMSRADQRNFLRALGEERAQKAGVNGIHLLFCRDPRFVQVTVWPESEQQDFTARDVKNLGRLLAYDRYLSGYDRALLDGLAMIQEKYQRDLGLANAAMMAIVVGAGLAIWLLLLLATRGVRSQAREDRPGLRFGFFGVLLGHAASMWVYDRLFFLESAGKGTEKVLPEESAPPPGKKFATVAADPVTTSASPAAPSLPPG